MMELRSHVWMPDRRSLCQLEANTGAIVASELPIAEIPACGPCLVAASALGSIATSVLHDSKAPDTTVQEATAQLLAGRFAEVGHAEIITQMMGNLADTFDGWALVALTGIEPEPTDPDSPATPPAAAGVKGLIASESVHEHRVA